MFRGTVDRAGNREGKKTSLRKTGKDKKQSSSQVQEEALGRTKPIPEFNDSGHENSIIDSGANLVNRHLENDLGRVIHRAKQQHVDAIVIITNDFEKSENSIKTSISNPGTIYSVVGIHPSNISSKKMSDKLFLQLINQLKTHSINQNVVGIYTGLDYERDYGLKFPQEKFMKAQISLAAELGLPVVLQDFGGGDGLLEVLKDSKKDIIRGMIYCFNSSSSFLQKFVDMDFYISFNGLLCEQSDKGDQLRDFITKVPLDRILLVSDSPNNTPQNIPDQHVRESRNEPSNLPFVLDIAATSLNMSVKDLSKQIKENSKRFYSLSLDSTTTTTTENSEENSVENSVEKTEEKNEEKSIDKKKASKGKGKNNNNNNLETTTTTTTTTTTKSSKEIEKLNKKSIKQQQKELNLLMDDEINSDDNDDDDEESDEEEEEEEESDEDEESKTIKKINKNISKLTKDQQENIHYSCKKCRSKLFTHGEIISHEEKSKVLDHNYIKQKNKELQQATGNIGEGIYNGNSYITATHSIGCKSFFLPPLDWMKVDITKNNFKVVCPNCDNKLGSYSHTGEKCSCSSMIGESCRILKTRVDTVYLGDNGKLLDLSLLNLEDDEDDEDDEDGLGKLKKKKSAKKNVKKDNRNNLSNYRNKIQSAKKPITKEQENNNNNNDSDSDN
ncbi:TatD-related deoxyribonuclease [Dictyostelium discoideum AX4]|uniref:TatD-related deoxyribonuclease n=1 Tax=Dictyostelium discoideum TaxID=44689 RepID=Q54KD6_DICDI|nr:TatD-related deoxyribonuclease [Dictyostelium discoideum AX4]EAL63766.1 TatD-related deoxyribonuclease [Dictyostelium discoideum AX4]|eukprot:XP_637287.1 TatD-related deoxyribonuclease [Dictyostelium discoideum AX4]